MLRYLAAFLFVSLSPVALPSAQAVVHLPDTLTVFVCQTAPGHSGLVGAGNWVDLDWVIDTSSGVPLHDCYRVYEGINDKEADADPFTTVRMHPDASNIDTCAYLAMQVPDNYGHGYFKYKVGCPREIINEKGEVTGYSDPPCPSDCDCGKNEPSDI